MAHAVIVAGGGGLRMGGTLSKQYLPLGGRPILRRTVDAFAACPDIAAIRLVIPESDADYCQAHILDALHARKPIRIVSGGRRRQDSVRNGLMDLKGFIDDPETVVAIHDGVRPLVRPEDIRRCVAEARKTGACILGAPVVDTLKTVDGNGAVRGTLARDAIWSAQTPQAFRFGLIEAAHEAALSEGIEGTDDAALVERMGIEVRVIEGSRFNLKITTPEDLKLAEAILSLSG